MSPLARRCLAAVALTTLLAALVVSTSSLPSPGEASATLSRLLVHASLVDRHTPAVVSGITFDVRAIDTLGEELILFVAAVGTAIVLRAQRSEDAARDAAQRQSDRRSGTPGPVRVLGAVLAGPLTVLGIYVVTHGVLTPGGGFQGGVLLAGVVVLVGTAGQTLSLERVGPVGILEVIEAAGVAAFTAIGVGGLLFAGGLLANFVPVGATGQLLSGGTVPLLSIATGVEVTGAFALVITELFDQAILRRDRSPA